eukprot:3320552-Rhodomonas_salina.2
MSSTDKAHGSYAQYGMFVLTCSACTIRSWYRMLCTDVWRMSVLGPRERNAYARHERHLKALLRYLPVNLPRDVPY